MCVYMPVTSNSFFLNSGDEKKKSQRVAVYFVQQERFTDCTILTLVALYALL